jgi:hypothetical protein
MDLERLERAEKLVKLGLGVNATLTVVNLLVLFALVVFVVNEPAVVAGVDPLEAQELALEESDPKAELRDFFMRTSDLLDRAARKNGTNPAEVLPTVQEIEDACETRTIHSDESQAVLQKLREGYDYYDLDWPLVMPQR